ncbi:MAG: hypothetical protein AAB217_21310 [Chloroflexota bacterium]
MNAQPDSRRRSLARLAWAIWALALMFSILGLTLLALTRDLPFPERWGFRGFPALLTLAFGTVGALIASRHPRNVIGWLFCVSGFLNGVQVFLEEYHVYANLAHPGTLPAGEVVQWIIAWLWVWASGTLWVFLLLLFPDGHLPSPRWRPIVWVSGAALAATALVFAFAPTRYSGYRHSFVIEAPDAIWGPVFTSIMTLLMACVLCAALSLLLRLRRAQGEKRQQLKWIVYAGVLLAAVSPFSSINALSGLLILALLGVPAATAIAILRYRLYDIDIIIRRTLVYSVLSGALALVYFGTVVLLQQLFRALTGQQSAVAIVVSTLAIAALFAPLRRRVQDVIDRRFYRKKYDAAKTLAEFAATCRDETDLDTLTARLVEVVEETMQPESVTLWLKSTESTISRKGIVDQQ